MILTLIPGGIEIEHENNWVPIYSWNLLIATYLLISVFILAPSIYLSIKLFHYFEDKILKVKFVYFIIGVFLLYLALYGAILYNTWQDNSLRSIWPIFSMIFLLSSSLLIYYGIGQDL
ncbi:MAG: hypothetical protein GF316_08250 [Candidatus Lokiarchaeota archaeon]|nr:hypothetical protein [Candidatus Lokiarchaeota archaeon]